MRVGISDVRPDIFLDLGRGSRVERLLMLRTKGLYGRLIKLGPIFRLCEA